MIADIDNIPPAYNGPSTDYYGQRVTSSGNVVTTYLAAQALSQLHVGEAEPVFQYFNDDRIFVGRNLPDFFKDACSVEGNTFQLAYSIPQDKKKRVTFSWLLKKAVESAENVYDRPLVFLVTSNAPHAIIYIIHQGNLYTVGFGFRDEMGQQKIAKILKPISAKMAHLFETLNGAIYTADSVMPRIEHAAKIAWVGFLDNNMIKSIDH
jgi:hypothetical protein